MKKAKLQRLRKHAEGILGVLSVEGVPVMFTLERPYLGNKPFISSVPPGEYLVEYEWSPKFERKLYELRNVEGRTEIKFHRISYVHQLLGCIGVGLKVYRHGNPFGSTSKKAEGLLHEIMDGESFMLTIEDWEE